jgi:hypothetical protein
MAPHQMGDRHLLVIDHVVLLDQRQRGLVVEVAPLPLDLLVRTGEHLHRLAPAVAPTRSLGHTLLARGPIPLRTAILVGMVEHRAIGQRGKGLQTEIDPGLLSGGRQRVHRHVRT